MSERTQQPQAAVGSTTVVATPAAEAGEAPVYRVQLQPRVRVTFDESAVDNEHMGRKKSNKCCIFHKKREFGESSSESGEDSSDDEEQKKEEGHKRKQNHHRNCNHSHAGNDEAGAH
ncbi:hypothetical protein Gpo141_00002067 [Globisporangium polare]